MNPTTPSPTALSDSFNARSENSYLSYIELCRKTECLGAEIKMEKGTFQRPELDAHKAAAEMLGRHRAYAEVTQELRALQSEGQTDAPPAKAEWVPKVGDRVKWRELPETGQPGEVVGLGQIALGRVQVQWPDLRLAIWELVTNLAPWPEASKEEKCSQCGESVQPCACMRAICDECKEPIGNVTFTVCDNCWDKLHPKQPPPEKWAEEKAAFERGEKIEWRNKFGFVYPQGWYLCMGSIPWDDDSLEFRIKPTPPEVKAGSAGEAAARAYLEKTSCSWLQYEKRAKDEWERAAQAAIAFHASQDRNSAHAVLMDALICSHIYRKEHETNPRLALADLIQWETQVALDPKVSEDARKLRDTFKSAPEAVKMEYERQTKGGE